MNGQRGGHECFFQLDYSSALNRIIMSDQLDQFYFSLIKIFMRVLVAGKSLMHDKAHAQVFSCPKVFEVP